MKITNLLAPLVLMTGCLALISCKSDPADGTSQTNGKIAKHLASLNHDYSKLLTKEDVLKHLSVDDAALVEMKYDGEAVAAHPEYGDCVYEWPSDRPPVKVNPQFPPQPDLNNVRISNLSFEDGKPADIRSSFDTAYKPMTAAEIDAATARMEKHFEGKPAEQLETAKGFLKSRGESKFRHVENVGDSAYWRPTKVMDMPLGVELVVLTGNAKFTITAKTSSDDEENLELAKKMAQEVLAKGG